MPRRARLAVPGIPWHIIQRGNNRSACYYADPDYQYYLATLGEQAEKFNCHIHAYVLMTNHVHLLVTPEEEDSAAQLMKNLGQRYVQYINRAIRVRSFHATLLALFDNSTYRRVVFFKIFADFFQSIAAR